MILPTTAASALVICLLSILCLGSWIAIGNSARVRWRFELFTLDFAFGFVVCSLLAAFTLGSMGSDLSFSDRLLVASHTAQAFVSAGGLLFGVGTVLLFGSISYAGISVGFPLVTALAFFLLNCFAISRNLSTALAGAGLLAVAALLVFLPARVRLPARARPQGKLTNRPGLSRNTKGLFLATLAGFVLGASSVLAGNGLWGDLGVGAYGGVVLFSVGALLSTVGLDLLLFNLPIEGTRLSPGAYFKLSAGQHTRGMATGVIWAIGLLSGLLARNVVASESVKLVSALSPAAAFALSLVWLVVSSRGRSKGALMAPVPVLRNGVLILVGLVLYAFASSE